MAGHEEMPHAALTRFSAATREWFAAAFSAPTAVQAGAWEAITGGSHTLVVAPTGSGKTLAAFLWAIDRLAAPPADEEAAGAGGRRGTKVLYISPLKALGVDVERNLRSPLVGIARAAGRLGLQPPEVSVGVRSGDTSQADRRNLVRRPPDILITTPESLFLMLTSGAREALADVDTVIVDEIHAVAGSKRGAHLALSLERLDALLESPAQRIGLSATVRPHTEVARFLGGGRPVAVVAPATEKKFDLSVVVPVADMTEIPTAPPGGPPGERAGGPENENSIWPKVERSIVEQILARRSTIVFANSRRLAERLTARFNEIYAELTPEGEETPAKPPPRRDAPPPAQMMAASGVAHGADPVLARAHHGSVSKEQRALIEDDLKSGRLRCVVATSSLELGIDMGAVDLVVQVESPPSVASGLQRIGRAGHSVGEVSYGVVYPKHRTDLLHAAIAAERMIGGSIEALRVPANPLDILAQQTVAAAAMDELAVDDWYEVVRGSAPFASLPRSAYEATLDLLAGRYPSDEFAELRPRIVWDRDAGTITGRPGAGRLAVTSGGTIPDRGLFGVFMVGEKASRVGELDEEMVYESRVGDVFTLGATSWRIAEITSDRVLVTPAFGQPGRLPFWRGDNPGRPFELGEATGAFIRELDASRRPAARERCRAAGLDEWATDNLLALLDEQREATGRLPHDRTFVVERFRDELGDWRVVLHSPLGMPVHAPWALAVGARLRERYGIDGAAQANDDGIVLRVPDMEDEPPGAELFVFEAEELERVVTAEVGGSALFAARFRECAARALLLPRRNPGRRAPLWQQRQRSAQLLDVARKFPTFPIILEAVRECLQDVYDLPSLKEVARSIEARERELVEVTTPSASPLARSLLFGYVAAFLYEGDSPLAERRAAALSLDSTLLSELLGRAELRELLDAGVIEALERELQFLEPGRRLRGAEGIADLLRLLGPLSAVEITRRIEEGDGGAAHDDGGPGQEPAAAEVRAEVTGWLEELRGARRILAVTIAGEERWIAVEDAGRMRDAIGTALPVGLPGAFTEPVADPLGDLIGRYARTHAPFTAAEVAERFALGIAVVRDGLRRLAAARRVVEGEFRPGGQGSEWVDAGVLNRLRRRSLAALRHEVEPVSPRALARFLPSWQRARGGLRGVDGLYAAVEQLAGAPLPASAWESLVLRRRVRDYSPAMLDELTASGEVLWSGNGALAGNDGWVSLHTAETAPLSLQRDPGFAPSEAQREIVAALEGGGAFFFRNLSDAVGSVDDEALLGELWGLVWAGWLSNDTFAPLRALIGGGKTAHSVRRRPPRTRSYRGSLGRAAMPLRTGPPSAAGRWSLLPEAEADPTLRAHALGEQLLERYGIVTRGAVMNERVVGGFSVVYKVLSRFEESGRTRRGYFVEGLGAAQFAEVTTIDRLRDFDRPEAEAGRFGQGTATGGGPAAGATSAGAGSAITLAATDPANPFGAALPWPEAGAGSGEGSDAGPGGSSAGAASRGAGGGPEATSGAVPVRTAAASSASRHRPGRKAGALVVLVEGALVLYVERGGRTVLAFSDDAAELGEAVRSLAETVRGGGLERLLVEKVNGAYVGGTEIARIMEEAGFYPSPRGLGIRPAPGSGDAHA